MSLRAVRILFGFISLLILVVFLNTLPERRNSAQLRFDQWLKSVSENPQKLEKTELEFSLPQSKGGQSKSGQLKSGARLSYTLRGESEKPRFEKITRLLELIETGNLFSIGSSKAREEAAHISIRDYNETFEISISPEIAQTVPSAALLLRLLVEYRTDQTVAEATASSNE